MSGLLFPFFTLSMVLGFQGVRSAKKAQQKLGLKSKGLAAHYLK
ncbi:MAG: hypothetical protein AAF204_02810 [Pseudomonadota bacterium]